METFQKIVLFSAIIILIITLVIIGMSLSNAKSSQTWPPTVPECPDYWNVDGSGNCINIRDLGTCSPSEDREHLQMDFSSSDYTGTQGACNKYTWATNCGVSWDGITYGVSNPCQTTS